MEYLHWKEKIITDFTEKAISDMYDQGYVFTRIGKGVMHQTRSVRIDLSKFELSSENKRILKKVGAVDSALTLQSTQVPVKNYNYKLAMDAKYFYEKKFGPGIMSAQKVKEMLTDGSKSNFTSLFIYSKASQELGYAICYENKEIMHYSYPFYHIDMSQKDMGMGMMTMAISRAKDAGKKYIYLGSLQRPTDTYKLQFTGLEWFDGTKWLSDLEEVKKILASASM